MGKVVCCCREGWIVGRWGSDLSVSRSLKEIEGVVEYGWRVRKGF